MCSVVTVTVVHNRGDSKNQTKTTNLKCVSSVTTGGSGRPVNAIRFFFLYLCCVSNNHLFAFTLDYFGLNLIYTF